MAVLLSDLQAVCGVNLWERLPAAIGWREAGMVCSAEAHSRAIDSKEGGQAFRAGFSGKARETFPSARESRGSGCALRRRPPYLRCRRVLLSRKPVLLRSRTPLAL